MPYVRIFHSVPLKENIWYKWLALLLQQTDKIIFWENAIKYSFNVHSLHVSAEEDERSKNAYVTIVLPISRGGWLTWFMTVLD